MTYAAPTALALLADPGSAASFSSTILLSVHLRLLGLITLLRRGCGPPF